MSLTRKQRRFVREYVKDLNGTQAAVRAGYSARTAQEQSSRLLSNVMVHAEILKRTARHFEKLDISAERILGELARLAFCNMADYIAVEDGNVRVDLSRVTRDQSAAICSLHITKDGDVRLRLADKRLALELLGKYQKLFTERHELLPSLESQIDPSKLDDQDWEQLSRLLEKLGVPPYGSVRPGGVQ